MKISKNLAVLPALAALGVVATSGVAQAAVETETAFVFNTFSFLIHGALVMWMAAGFAMLEAGLVRTKNTATICLKNIALYAMACIMYYLVGYNLMYTGVDGGFIGTFSLFYDPSAAEAALIAATDKTAALVDPVVGNKYAVMSDWFFQVVFVATAASVVSGTVAERMKLWPFMVFTMVLTAVIYPITGSWAWGQGWLAGLGFKDFAGSTLVHSVGGWAALTGAILLGPRKGKFNADGSVNPFPGSNLPLATLGTFILWFGWFGFNGGSQLALGSAADAVSIANVYANTNIAACAGIVAAMMASQVLFKKVDLSMSLNGALAGLVAITAGPDVPTPLYAIIIGGVGGVLAVVAVPIIDKLKIDDVVGALSVHLVNGIWGTLCVGIFDGGDIVAQITGIVAIGAFTVVATGATWAVLKYTVGIRVTEEEEFQGQDKAELGMEAYPEFGTGSARL
ncbi:ammonium transporter [Oleispirillum naphthae]|uniref:ammonium transporter n=1 Tax=Oleispirillum naphthae TaxID=2838853 RepID=UPI0030823B38